ncbi:MAG: metal-dependent hydrolase [Verrucomicrobiota bacterium]
MHTLTHALLPVLALSAGSRRTTDKGPNYWNWKRLLLVALAGALPDLLNPHLSLQARYTSWSHGVPALCAFCLVLVMIWLIRRHRSQILLFIMLGTAYGLHLFCDLISGGLAWQYPLGNHVVGDYYVSARWWVPLDVGSVVLTYLIYRAIPNFRKWRERRRKVQLDFKWPG